MPGLIHAECCVICPKFLEPTFVRRAVNAGFVRRFQLIAATLSANFSGGV